MLTACKDDNYRTTASDNRVPLSLVAGMADGTRLDGTQWEEGDQIGVFLQAYDASLGNGSPYVEGVVNVPFDVNPSDGSCTPVDAESAIFLEKGQTYAVLAYYPYTEDLSHDTDENAAVYAIDSWTKQSNQSKLDLLIARTYGVTADESSVSLTLERAASRLQLNIAPSSGMSADAMYNVSAWVSGLNHYMDWDMRGRSISHQGLVDDSIPFTMTLDDATGMVTGVAIVPPSDGTTITGISISIALSETDVRTIAIDDETRFEAGKSYSWNVSLSPGADIDAIVEQILNMTESGTVTVDGYLTADGIARINSALKTLYDSKPDVEVTLDMADATGLTELPNATSDETQSFSNCANLAGVILPQSVTKIGDYAFQHCSKLRSIDFPESLSYIGTCAFYYSGLQSVVVPNGVTEYGEQIFCGSSDLVSAVLGTGFTTVSGKIFWDCSSLASVELHGEIVGIGSQAFRGCRSLETFDIPATVTSIGELAFYQSGLTSVSIPGGVESIAQQTFFGCSSLQSVSLSEGLQTIGTQAFCSCGLNTVTIPGTVTTISGYAFMSCSGLESVVLSSSVREIGQYAFTACNALSTVYYEGTEADREAMTIEDETITGSGVTWVYSGQ